MLCVPNSGHPTDRASKERGKRAAFAEIVRSGHSKQNQHAVFVHSTVVRKHLFVLRRRSAFASQLARFSITAVATPPAYKPRQ